MITTSLATAQTGDYHEDQRCQRDHYDHSSKPRGLLNAAVVDQGQDDHCPDADQPSM
jgi:hypothetical protein